MKHIVLALAALAALPMAVRAETIEPLGPAGSVTFPRGTPKAIGRQDAMWSVKDGNESFIAGSLEVPSSPELDQAFKSCPTPPVEEDEQGRISCRTSEADGDPVKEVTTSVANGDLMVVRIIAHAGRTYQAQYTRRGGSGPISADGERFLDSLHVNH